ncbi:unnamed protein product [Schistosoma turkestanicum]|nr:unnamed protein product [Schistosoma turkestanicum]CAH8506702.1 unnamed protein product [Schistosoma turkestanicum]CAH8506733.1 unnamed protein product [Schistosoma turkestanicum]
MQYLCLGVLLQNFSHCQDVCRQFDDFKPMNYEGEIYENASYRQSDHHYYRLVTQRSQYRSEDLPSVKQKLPGSIVKFTFPITFYGEQYGSFTVDAFGAIVLLEPRNSLTGDSKIILLQLKTEYKLVHSWAIGEGNVIQGLVRFKIENWNWILVWIYPNGKISIYYDLISSVKQRKSGIYSSFNCKSYSSGTSKSYRYNEIYVPSDWITDFTLVEFEPMTKLCSSQVSNDSCQAASTTNVTCLWCSKASKCSNGQDVYTAFWQQKKCNKLNKLYHFSHIHRQLNSIFQ